MDGLTHCPYCGAQLSRCRACGQRITRHYVEVNGAGPFCETCYQSRPACVACGAPIAGGGRALPDGRRICAGCAQTAVHNEAAARVLFDQVQAILRRELGLALNVPTPVYLADREQLKMVTRRVGQQVEPLTLDRTLGVYLRQGRRRGIYALVGLPQTLLNQVLAHEWAHAWQAEHNPIGGDLLVWEGFAEWVAYRTMGGLGQAEAQRQMRARDDVYGDGLRRMLEVEKASGIESVLEIGCSGRRKTATSRR
jgi:hypothetical protein